MARKNLLSADAEADDTLRPTESRPPALSAMRRSLEATFAASVQDLAPDLIDEDGIVDRMSQSEEDLADLTDSIRLFGQRVPVLVRPNAARPGRYIVVYGRRRIRAVRAIGEGRTVKALILSENLDDQALVRIQGQENSVRRDLTFIERAMFAKRLEQAGYDNKLIREALNIDKAGLSQMRAVTDGGVPLDLIEAIGPAPGIGRDRWMALARMLVKAVLPPDLSHDPDQTSDERFFATIKAISGTAAPTTADLVEVRQDGAVLGRVKRSRNAVALTVTAKEQPDLHRWVRDNPEAAVKALLAARNT